MPPGTSAHAAWRALLVGLFLWPGRGSDEVSAEADQGGLGLGRTGGEQDLLAPLWVGPLLAQRPARTLDPVDGGAGETSPLDLLLQVVRRMEVRGGEELRPANRM